MRARDGDQGALPDGPVAKTLSSYCMGPWFDPWSVLLYAATKDPTWHNLVQPNKQIKKKRNGDQGIPWQFSD